jgi:hypothetical protein
MERRTAEPVTAGLPWVARWHPWAPGDSHIAKRFGWLELYVAGFKVADFPMQRWDKAHREEPTPDNLGKAAAAYLEGKLR